MKKGGARKSEKSEGTPIPFAEAKSRSFGRTGKDQESPPRVRQEKLDALEERTDVKFEVLDARLDAMNESLDAAFDRITALEENALVVE